MFLVYIKELAVVLGNYGIKIKLFAFHAKLYVQILNDIHVVLLQQAIDALVSWATEWQLGLSISVNK